FLHAIRFALCIQSDQTRSLFLNPDDGSTHSDVSLELPWRRLALPVAGLSLFLGGYSPIQRCRPGPYPSPLAPQNKKRAWKFSLFLSFNRLVLLLRGLFPLYLPHLCPSLSLGCCYFLPCHQGKCSFW